MPTFDSSQIERDAPVSVIDTGSTSDDPRQPQPGIGLCLSGGGYRAMLFHLGALKRLNEWGYLRKLARISSVSGGSITAGWLGARWNHLTFDNNGSATNFDDNMTTPLRTFAGETIDEWSIIVGILSPGSIADKVTDAYRTHLFGSTTLHDLPSDPPRFVINATNVQTGVLFRFSKPYLADYRVGQVLNPNVDLAVAVAASSAFPPLLSPLHVEFSANQWAPASGRPSEDCHREPFLTHVVLTDGGVYDNLGLETTWKKYQTVLVSDGGGKMAAEQTPKGDWPRHAIRINDIIDNQVRSLRKRQLIASYRAGPNDPTHRSGTYWGIRSDIRNYALQNALPCPCEKTTILANLETRLKRLGDLTQERLINWGYAICDAAMRRWVDPQLPAARNFPYSSAGIG